MKKEVFKEIPLVGYDNFRISNRERILNIVTGNFLTPRPDKDGYSIATIHVNNETKQVKLHRLVGYAFIPNPHNKPQINHKDGIKDNNYYLNIEWCTPKENTDHATLHNLRAVEERHPKAKLDRHSVLLIRDALLRKETVKSICEDFAIGKTAINSIKYNRCWKSVQLQS